MNTILPLYERSEDVTPADFHLVSAYEPAGDQPEAIQALIDGLQKGERNQVLLGVTGSGKTFTMAQIIQRMKRPALILAPNKILAAQLYGEMKSFFPDNAVEYFVSYYDYYQPEAYIPRTDTYIEKDSAINEQIDRMRHGATRHILERRDVIIVASVSCIYGLGSVESYSSMAFSVKAGEAYDVRDLARQLVELQYQRNELAFTRGTFRLKGDVLDIFPSHYEDLAWRLSFFGDELESISEFDPLTGVKKLELKEITVYPASHYVTPRPALSQAMKTIKQELKERLIYYASENKPLEAERIEQRTRFDLEMLEATGHCKGIENYSRHLTGRAPGEPPPTLFEYLPKDALLFVDESHVSVPQLGGMYRGDYNRKSTLATYGFRLPSCVDNRPFKVRGMGQNAAANDFRFRNAGAVGVGADAGRIYRTDHSSDRIARPVVRSPSRRDASRRPDGGMSGVCGKGTTGSCYDFNQENGGRLDRLSGGKRRQSTLYALGYRHAGTYRDRQGSALGRV